MSRIKLTAIKFVRIISALMLSVTSWALRHALVAWMTSELTEVAAYGSRIAIFFVWAIGTVSSAVAASRTWNAFSCAASELVWLTTWNHWNFPLVQVIQNRIEKKFRTYLWHLRAPGDSGENGKTYLVIIDFDRTFLIISLLNSRTYESH